MSGTEYRPPAGWGSDTLTAYLEQACRSRHATFANKREAYAKLAAIDAAFCAIETDWQGKGGGEYVVASMLFVRSHCAFRTAAEHAMAGQVAEVYPQVRAGLEYAAYALHMALHPPLAELWMRRHDSDDALRAVRKEFTLTTIRATIAGMDANVADIFDKLYQQSIDFGAHPNERAITAGLAIKSREDGAREFQQKMLHGDGLQMDYALKTTARAGVCSLEILQGAFSDRFREKGVTKGLHVLRRGL